MVREVTAFCESGAPGSNSAGDEYLHLPAIVDAAETALEIDPSSAEAAPLRLEPSAMPSAASATTAAATPATAVRFFI